MAVLEDWDVEANVRLMRVSNTSVLQIRFKNDAGKWQTKSSGERDLVKAIGVAANLNKSTIPTFKAVMDMWVKTIDESKRKYKDYISSLYNYTLPTLSEKRINEITQKDINELLSAREMAFKKRYKRQLSKGTILNWNAAISHVFNYAVIHEFVHHTQLPKLSIVKQGEGSKRRLHFTDEQVSQLINSEFFIQPTANKKSILIRSVLLPYIEFLLGSGIRHGTETNNLLFGDLKHGTTIQRHDGLEVNYTSITVRKGKTTLYTGDREAILRQEAFDALQDIGEIVGTTGKTFKQSRMLGTITPERLQAVFKQLLKFEGIDTAKGYSLYSLRHTYITRRILEGRPTSLIAKQCGTSQEMIERNYSHLTARMNAIELI